MLSERQAYLALSQFTARRVNALVREAGSAAEAARRLRCRAVPAPGDFVAPCDAEYPAALHQLTDPPSVLYYRGRLPPAEQICVAVVGTRRASTYGLGLAVQLGRELASAGLTVVSGLARGIDAAAHRGSLEATHELPALAVLGCGLNVDYPPEHRALQREIARRGGVLSEYPADCPPEKWHFPARNRVVAALASAVVVVEAPLSSGALITVDHALDLGREVLVVPGPVGWRQSEGTLALLRDGATLVRGAEDVFSALGLASPRPQEPELDELLVALSPLGSSLEELQAHLQVPVGQLLARLTRLQVGGRVIKGPDGRWGRT